MVRFSLSGIADLSQLTIKPLDGRQDNQPPLILPVSEGEDYWIKRSTQNYLVMLRLPVGETRAQTAQRIFDMLPHILGDITIDRMN